MIIPFSDGVRILLSARPLARFRRLAPHAKQTPTTTGLHDAPKNVDFETEVVDNIEKNFLIWIFIGIK